MTYASLDIAAEFDGKVWPFGPPVTLLAPHTHRELELNLITAGEGVYLVDDQRYDLHAGTLIWLFPRQEHLLLRASPDFRMWIVVLTRRMLQRTCRTPWSAELLRPRPSGVFCQRLSLDRMESLSDSLQRVIDLGDQPDRHNAALADALLTAWAEHHEAQVIGPTADVHPAVERAARLIRTGEADASLDEIAHAAGLSPSYLSRLFKQHTGISLSSFRQRRRLDRFLEIYGKGRRYNLTEAALAAGFGSYPQFHRVFRQAFGHSPAEHRRRLS